MKNLDKYNLIIINFLFFLFPLSIILGNFFTNLNLLLLSFTAFFFYKKKIIEFKINIFDKIILIFFIYTFITLIINLLENYLSGKIFPEIIIHKTFFYFRYYIIYLILRVLVSEKILRLDWFSLACAICASLICLDIIFQFFIGKNIFGLTPSTPRHFSGVFGEELIAGGYLQKFALFSFFLPFVLKKKKIPKIVFQLIFFIFFMFGIALSGNRMPFALFIFSFFIYFLLNSELRKYSYALLIVVFLFLSLNYNLNQNFKMRFDGFYMNGKILVNSFFVKDVINNKSLLKRPYVSEFICAKSAFKENPIFGGGIRFYRNSNQYCNTHPHNYYLEIMVDLGVAGLSVILVFIFMLLRRIFMQKILSFNSNLNPIDDKLMPFFLIFFIEFFPVRTAGSFFSTNVASIIFVVLAIIVSSLSKKKNYNN